MANYQLDPAAEGDNSIVCNLPDGTNIGIVNLVAAFQRLQLPPGQGLGGEIVNKSAALERRFGVQVTDFFLALAQLSLDAVPATPPVVQTRWRGFALQSFTTMPTPSPARFRVQGDYGPSTPGMILTGQSLSFDDLGEPAAPAITLLLRLVPVVSPREFAVMARRS